MSTAKQIMSLVLCLLTFFLCAQHQKSAFNSIDSQYDLLKLEINSAPIDTTKKRIYKLLNAFRTLEPLDSIYKLKKGETLIYLLDTHTRNNAYDSTEYYFEYIDKNFKDTLLLAKANNRYAIAMYRALNYDSGFFHSRKALNLMKNYTNHPYKQDILFNLSYYYRSAKDYELAGDIQHQLQESITDSTDLSTLFLIQHEKYELLTHEKEYEGALEVLKNIDTTGYLRQSKYLYRGYYDALAMVHKNLKQYDSALYYNDIAVNSTYSIPGLSPIDDYSYYVDIYHSKENHTKALEILNSIPDTSTVNNTIFSLKDFHELSYKVHNALGNYTLALRNLEKLNEINKKLNDEVRKKQNAILKYNLQKDIDLNRIKSEKAQQKIKLEAKQERLTYIYLIIITAVLSLGLVLYLIFKHKQQKKQLALEEQLKINQLKNKYIENITNEFKTPLGIVDGYLNLIKTYALSPGKIPTYVNLSQVNNERLLNRLEDLMLYLNFESADKSKTNSLKEKNLLNFVIYELQKFEHGCHIKNLKLVLYTNLKPQFRLKFDYDRLSRVIRSLVTNAKKYSKPHQAIEVYFNLEKDHMVLKVKDEGNGIAQQYHDKLFDRFFQVDELEEKHGFGIGLSLVHDIVKIWDGDIRVESELGQGANFTITIPMKETSLTDGIGEHQNIILADYQSKALHTHKDQVKILVVENNLQLVDYLNEILSPNYEFDTAFNGEEAYKLLLEVNYKLIISDYIQPGINGLELRDKLVDNPKTSNIPFILIGDKNLETEINAYKEDGQFVYLKKPLSEIKLKEEIEKYIGRKLKADLATQTATGMLKEKTDHANTFLKAVNTYIIENLDNDELKVEDIASHLGSSQKQFSELVHEYTGYSPVRIIQEIRLQKAYEYIKASKYRTIGELMAAVGFNSRSHFYKVFKERFGEKAGELFKAYKK